MKHPSDPHSCLLGTFFRFPCCWYRGKIKRLKQTRTLQMLRSVVQMLRSVVQLLFWITCRPSTHPYNTLRPGSFILPGCKAGTVFHLSHLDFKGSFWIDKLWVITKHSMCTIHTQVNVTDLKLGTGHTNGCWWFSMHFQEYWTCVSLTVCRAEKLALNCLTSLKMIIGQRAPIHQRLNLTSEHCSLSWVDTYHRSNLKHWVTCQIPFWVESSCPLKLYSLTYCSINRQLNRTGRDMQTAHCCWDHKYLFMIIQLIIIIFN